MDEYRSGPTSLTDDAVDRAIDELLDVESSADFMARVRTRINREPPPSQWFAMRWTPVGAAAAAVLMLIAVWATRPALTEPPARSTPQATAAAVTPPIDVDDVRAPRAEFAAATPSPSLHVLISPADADGLRYLMSALSDGRLDPRALPFVGEEVEPPMPLVIEPIVIEPLAVVAALEPGVLQ